ncbi:hypothetical protein [Abyssogena phaseoliformis symbiont]|uniref:hypothetical protein n=1 Tax=Abyssogena phaseoliformis symbiont TaxID=596095 RepID=UPI001CEE028A|nr:hypothetical protein [Abyssogena phaseoliformis symbiont]MBW5288777.1 hypothetical protein [Candidatus Ruthia sp. Apha_13_S6]
MWLDGKDIDDDGDMNDQSIGNTVSQWRDKSGNNIHISSSSTERLTVSAGGVNFDGSNDYLTTTDGNAWSLGSSYTAFYAVDSDKQSSSQDILIAKNSAGNYILTEYKGNGSLRVLYRSPPGISGGIDSTSSLSEAAHNTLTVSLE